jgi:hypothetical protein
VKTEERSTQNNTKQQSTMNEDPSPSPTTKHPQKLPTGANKADQTKKNYDCGVVYINKWMVENEHPLFEALTDEHVEADHLQNYMENIMHWLAITPFKTSSGYLQNSVKTQYFSNIKNAFKSRFPNREIWKDDDYWKDLLKDFKKCCERSRILDPSVVETRKSAPLYRDVSQARTRTTTVRAKHMNEKADAKGVAMGMIKEATAYSIQKLAEFCLCSQAIGRGGEHVFLRWTEMRWDDFFRHRILIGRWQSSQRRNAPCCSATDFSIACARCFRWVCS